MQSLEVKLESLGHRWTISKNKAIESFGPDGVVGSVEDSSVKIRPVKVVLSPVAFGRT